MYDGMFGFLVGYCTHVAYALAFGLEVSNAAVSDGRSCIRRPRKQKTDASGPVDRGYGRGGVMFRSIGRAFGRHSMPCESRLGTKPWSQRLAVGDYFSIEGTNSTRMRCLPCAGPQKARAGIMGRLTHAPKPPSSRLNRGRACIGSSRVIPNRILLLLCTRTFSRATLPRTHPQPQRLTATILTYHTPLHRQIHFEPQSNDD